MVLSIWLRLCNEEVRWPVFSLKTLSLFFNCMGYWTDDCERRIWKTSKKEIVAYVKVLSQHSSCFTDNYNNSLRITEMRPEPRARSFPEYEPGVLTLQPLCVRELLEYYYFKGHQKIITWRLLFLFLFLWQYFHIFLPADKLSHWKGDAGGVYVNIKMSNFVVLTELRLFISKKRLIILTITNYM
jgi:hypothetical protein